jgi:hypothetical protein
MAHPSMPKSPNLPNINMYDKSPIDYEINYDSDNDENDNEAFKKYQRSYLAPEGSILFCCLDGVKENVRKGELMGMAKGQKLRPTAEDPVVVGLKSRPILSRHFLQERICGSLGAHGTIHKQMPHV